MTCRLLVVLLGLAAVLSGCGGNDTPAAPSTPATPTVSALTISGNDAIRTGFFANYTATAQLSNGTTQSVTPTWSSSNPSVGSVDTTGRLDGRTHGSINLAASYQGLNASKNVNVVHNYGGSWTGTYVIRACDQSGVFARVRWCQAGGVGDRFGFSLALTQGGNGRDEVGGTVSFYNLAGNISGNVTGDGRLVIGGTYNVTTPDIAFRLTVGGWDTRPAAGDSMTGGWALNLTAIGATGNGYEEHQIVAVTRTSQQISVSAAPDHYVLSLTELFQRMGR
jgi:hypothetical protein